MATIEEAKQKLIDMIYTEPGIDLVTVWANAYKTLVEAQSFESYTNHYPSTQEVAQEADLVRDAITIQPA
jgi:hypothetical protein